MRLVVIGGSDAGISAALRARELAPEAQVTMVVADAYPNFSICGLPFYHSGEVTDWRSLAHRTRHEIEATGIALLLDHTATAIDSAAHQVTLNNPHAQQIQLPYDTLVVGTGATPLRPPIAGLELPGVFTLHTMGSSFALEQYLVDRRPRSALIIGAGYIGLEMADALTLRGITTTLVSRPATALPTVDPAFGQQVAAELQRHGVAIVTNTAITTIEAVDGELLASNGSTFAQRAELVLVATGVQPASALLAAAGVATGAKGALRVTRRMATGISDIYAAGDCVETWHRLLETPLYLPLGTTAHKQGRVAGENAVGGEAVFAGTLGTQVVKVFDLVIGRTGLRDDEAQQVGFAALTVETTTWDHKQYYPHARPLQIRLTGNRRDGRLLGAQLLGAWGSEVSKRVDIFAAALYQGLSVAQLSELDLSYTPPLSSPWDPVQMAAQAWERAARLEAAV